MSKYIFLCVLLLSLCSVKLQAQSQIIHQDFGDGWIIDLNDNVAVDMDDDGQRDFFINRVDGELGFTGIFSRGCFASPSENAMTPFGSRELKVFEKGDLIQMNNSNSDEYIEDTGSAYSTSGGYAEGWEDNNDYYIGLALLNSSLLAKNAWIRVSINADAQRLIIKEWAYTTVHTIDDGGIHAGSRESLTHSDQLLDASDILISPNPVSDRMNVRFDSESQEHLSVSVYNSAGIEIYQQQYEHPHQSIEIKTDVWPGGSYIVRLQNAEGIHTQQVLIVR
jgi:hypothetical protein